MDKVKLMEILDKNINQEQLMKDLALELVIPYLEAKAKETGTPIDDMIVAQLKAVASK